MNAEVFKDELLKNDKTDYGICPPPLEAQKGLDILIDHFLGKDWYVSMPVSQKQVNAEAVYAILKKYGEKRKIWKFFQQHTKAEIAARLAEVDTFPRYNIPGPVSKFIEAMRQLSVV